MDQIRRISFLFLCFLGLLTACSPDSLPDDPVLPGVEQPNILLIIADDVGVDAVPAYPTGAAKPAMPNLTALADEGLTFDQAWTNPICSPTRATILTGRYGFRTGVLNANNAARISTDETALHTYLESGTGGTYRSALIGKWHLSPGVNALGQLGINHFSGILGGAVQDYSEWNLTENGTTQLYQGYATSKITDLAIDWIDQQSTPWFCWLAYNAPHTPFHVPPVDLHNQGALPEDSASIDANPLPYYHAMLESLDAEIGRLLNSLSASERANTLIVFIGDNGTPRQVIQSPYRRSQAKGTLYQGGIHVPMIVSGSGVDRKGQRDSSLVNSVDLFPTIAEIAGMSLERYGDAYSFASLLNTRESGPREYAFSEVSEDGVAIDYTIRSERYKLINTQGQEELYDLLSDPYETTDLLIGTLSDAQAVALQALRDQVLEIRQ